ncbi:hypothetical protein [Sulfurivermis fontis]|uniref:hypothetical protein n=1 Tax=Sulfurivermis fontis TaxID=1972068 RepID=UPI000FD859B5|nr:hypothetical protein [Sulfurivermis fontis]
MEIRHSPLPLYSPLQPAQSPARAPAPQETGTPPGLPQDRRGNGLTEYIARGEVVEGNDSTDYRELIRAARQQRAETMQEASAAPGNGTSPYAARALSAYLAYAGGAVTGIHQGLDEIV